MGMFRYLRDNNPIASYCKEIEDYNKRIDKEKLEEIARYESELRDNIAIEAINLFSTDKEDILKILENIPARHDIVAKFCYDIANAMIKERSKYAK